MLEAVSLPRRLDLTTARGQYAAGWSGGVKVPGFLDEEGIPKSSTTETYAAITLGIDNRRWAGVPFYLRNGKRLGRRVTEVAVVFKRAPHLPFHASATEELTQNALVVRVQPDEGLTMRFGSKVPGTQLEIRDVNMDFAYGGSFTESSPEAYERLILDVLLGDPPLFPRHEEVELSWKILDPILDHWARRTPGRRAGRSATRPAPGGRPRPTRCWPATAGPGGDRDEEVRMIELTDTNSAGIAAEFVRGRTRAGSPAMGMVMTLVIVVDEDDAQAAMDAAREASHEHPARVLGVILGDGRGARTCRRPGRHRPGLVRRDRADPAHAARWSSTPSRWCCRCCCPTPPSSSGGRPTTPADPAADPLGQLAQRRITDSAFVSRGKVKALHAQCEAYAAGNTDLAWTRITPWRALLAAALDQHPLKVRRVSVAAERISPSADLLLAWLADRLRVPAERKTSDGPRHHRGRDGDRRGPDPDRPWRRQAGDVLLPRPARPAGRAQAP